jgi:hypothetical protein
LTNFLIQMRSRVTRWVGEKHARNGAQPIFGRNLYINFTEEKSCPKRGLILEFSKNPGSMLWSQMSAIFDNFRRKYWRFSKKKTMLWSKFLHNLALFWVKNADFFSELFGENIFKILTSVPDGLTFVQSGRPDAEKKIEQ